MNNNKAKNRILEATIRTIYADGLGAASLRTVAKRADLNNQSVISYYFGSKENLMLQCMKSVFRKIILPKKKVLESPVSPEQKVDDVLRAMKKFTLTQKKPGVVFIELWCLAMRDKKIRKMFSEMYAENRRTIEAIIREGKEQGAFANTREDIVSTFILAYVLGMAFQINTHISKKDFEDHYRVFRAVVKKILLEDPPKEALAE